MFTTTASGRRARRSAVALMMRKLAWCGMNASMSEQFLAELGLFAHGKLKHLLPILVYVMHSLFNRFFTRRVQAASPGHVKELSPRTIDFVNEIDQPYR